MASHLSIPRATSLLNFTLKNNQLPSGVIHMLEAMCMLNMLTPFLVQIQSLQISAGGALVNN